MAMARTIHLSTETTHNHIQPECDQASCCYWFEAAGAASPRCANRNSMVCRKRLDDVFAPHDRKRVVIVE
jgi:hypothetical protein